MYANASCPTCLLLAAAWWLATRNAATDQFLKPVTMGLEQHTTCLCRITYPTQSNPVESHFPWTYIHNTTHGVTILVLKVFSTMYAYNVH